MPQDSVYKIKYIVPFFHDAKNPTVNSYDLINRSLCKTEDWIASSANIIKKNDIFAFVLHSLEGAETYSFPKEKKESGCICSVWKNRQLEKRNCRYVNREHNKAITIDFDLVNIELYLFWNHVGLLCYEISHINALNNLLSYMPEVPDICEFHHHMMELGQRGKKILFGEILSEQTYDNSVFIEILPSQDKKKSVVDTLAGEKLIKLINQNGVEKYITSENLSGNGNYFDVKKDFYYINEIPENASYTYMTAYKPLNIGLWVDDMLSKLKTNPDIEIGYFSSINPFSNDPNRSFADKAIPFIYTSLNDDPPRALQVQKDITFKLGNGYPLNYNSITNLEKFWEHSEDVLWYASRQGCCCTIKKGNSYSKYFENKMNSEKNDSYFLLFLLQLNQMYGLVYYSKMITENLSSDISAYTTDNVNLQKNLQRIHAEINLFLMKSTYASISNIQRQNEFFSYLREQLNLEQDIQSVQSGLDGLDKLQDSLTQRADEKKANASERKLSLSLGLLALLATFSTVTDLYTLFLGKTAISYPPKCIRSFLFFVLLGIILLSVGYVFKNMFSSWKRLFKSDS